MNNQELKVLIIKFAKALEASEMECIDNAICNEFKSQLNMQQPETILNHVHELEDQIKSLQAQLEEAQNKEPEKVEVIKEVEVEKVIEKEVIKEVEKKVIPTEVQEELETLREENKFLQDELVKTLDMYDDLVEHCHELTEAIGSMEDEPDEVELDELGNLDVKVNKPIFEEPEEVSNEDILAMSGSEDEVDDFITEEDTIEVEEEVEKK